MMDTSKVLLILIIIVIIAMWVFVIFEGGKDSLANKLCVDAGYSSGNYHINLNQVICKSDNALEIPIFEARE